MASFAKNFFFFLLLTLLSSLHTHARDSQFFNKVPSTTNTVVVPNNKETLTNQQEQPNFLPENENAYGLYGHESGQLPPSATTPVTVEPAATTATGKPISTAATTTTPYNMESSQPAHKYLPKNYNPVAYVTVPEGINDNEINNNNNNNYYNGAQNYYNNQEEEQTEYRSYPTTTNTRDNHNYYNGASSFTGQSDTRFRGSAAVNSRERYFNNGGEVNAFQPQGMSDTRFVENGKYFYDLNAEKYSNNHPYESLRGIRGRNEYNNNRNFYENRENTNGYEFNGENSLGGYQNEEEFQEENNAMP
ncbi:hypothetical protein CDL12_20891 [Handroanthus impetiginosus]|uniref:Protein E6-like n=1 Tax=Handroanthus impetiginosus TaxID=429701 RepID=A0A2G9GMV5_9LAMI|nr:hypothetical protein CDL12_20891 [Handroanthus impetiginosus]